MLKFENNIEGRARLWDTALKFLSPVPRATSPDHLVVPSDCILCSFFKFKRSPLKTDCKGFVKLVWKKSNHFQRSLTKPLFKNLMIAKEKVC